MNEKGFPPQEYNSEEYDRWEKAFADRIAADEATIGEIEPVAFDFCEDCPLMLGIRPKDIDGQIDTTMSIRGGLKILVAFYTRKGQISRDMVLGTHDDTAIGSRRCLKIESDASKRTRECPAPRRVPWFLGPFAVKKCQAIEESYQASLPARLRKIFSAN